MQIALGGEASGRHGHEVLVGIGENGLSWGSLAMTRSMAQTPTMALPLPTASKACPT